MQRGEAPPKRRSRILETTGRRRGFAAIAIGVAIGIASLTGASGTALGESEPQDEAHDLPEPTPFAIVRITSFDDLQAELNTFLAPIAPDDTAPHELRSVGEAPAGPDHVDLERSRAALDPDEFEVFGLGPSPWIDLARPVYYILYDGPSVRTTPRVAAFPVRPRSDLAAHLGPEATEDDRDDPWLREPAEDRVDYDPALWVRVVDDYVIAGSERDHVARVDLIELENFGIGYSGTVAVQLFSEPFAEGFATLADRVRADVGDAHEAGERVETPIDAWSEFADQVDMADFEFVREGSAGSVRARLTPKGGTPFAVLLREQPTWGTDLFEAIPDSDLRDVLVLHVEDLAGFHENVGGRLGWRMFSDFGIVEPSVEDDADGCVGDELAHATYADGTKLTVFRASDHPACDDYPVARLERLAEMTGPSGEAPYSIGASPETYGGTTISSYRFELVLPEELELDPNELLTGGFAPRDVRLSRLDDVILIANGASADRRIREALDRLTATPVLAGALDGEKAPTIADVFAPVELGSGVYWLGNERGSETPSSDEEDSADDRPLDPDGDEESPPALGAARLALRAVDGELALDVVLTDRLSGELLRAIERLVVDVPDAAREYDPGPVETEDRR